MSKAKTPTPSERLLRKIRSPHVALAAGRDEARAAGPASDRPRRETGRFAPVFGARAVVGVDVGRRDIHVATIRRRDGEFEMLALERVEFDPAVGIDSEEFARILGSVLSRATLKVSHPDIWCSLASAQADMRLVGVPRVPASQRDNAVFWTARKEMSFDEKAVIFDFEDRGEMVDKGAVKSAVFAHTIPRDEVTRRRNSFVRAGYPLSGMTLPPFADQNVFRSGCLPPPPGGAANLYVGSNWSRLEIFRDGNLVFTRGIKAAMAALTESIREGLAERAVRARPGTETFSAAAVGIPDFGELPAEVVLDLDDDQTVETGEEPRLLSLEIPGQPITPEPLAGSRPSMEPDTGQDMDRREPEARDVTDSDAAALLLSLVDGEAGPEPEHPGPGLSADEIVHLADPALSRLARQVEMTLKHYREALGNDPVGALYVSGRLAAAPAFLEYLESHLGIPCEPFDPLGASGTGRPGPGVDPDGMSLAERCRYQQALGVALSQHRMTPDLFVTYKERREASRVRLVNRAMIGAFCLALLILAGTYALVSGRNQDKARELGRLREQIAAQGVMVDTPLLRKTAEEAKHTQESLKAFAVKNFGLAAIGELSALTPRDVRLLNLTLDMGPPAKDAPGPKAPAKPGKGQAREAKAGAKYIKKIILDGVVEGDSQIFESVLAGYLVNLQNSPLFGDSTVSKRDVEVMGGAQVLHFVVSLILTDQ